MKEMLKHKRASAFLLLALALVLVMSGCSSSTGQLKTTDDGRIVVDFWYALGGNLGEAVEAVVAGFNESQDEVYVNAVYQGSYEESLT
ncbi:glycerol-3-phosphate ABC transporter substrate-binding protein [Caldalkalibacillus thermarum TA2.A1]|uniref:Glycerol-3-phosphate ABC transporter substrate-binding protein n=3 Tax=Caldalkalibacillus TaxID=379065 RepID=F5LB91_CALTT|nr:hypothetical protein [Caldalkalibacillus thermarum]EGL81393.1 glycerol-3-phosphate ABC transporter substrate-binding protein [Caldalkalibacillus thermarum TA2.A1]GGK17053.1 hypothetical protein GCM10010965_07630 [Caldalkalibacillus thermarum]